MNQSVRIDLRAYFGLSSIPFTREFSIEKRFLRESAEKDIEAFHQTIDQRMSGGYIGAAGVGKSVEIRALVARLPEARYRVSYLMIAGIGRRDFCKELSGLIGCKSAGQFNTLVHNIQEHIQNLVHTDGVRSVIIIDEAQDMTPAVLSILRLLTNYDMDSKLVFSIILVGQNKLETMLKSSELEPFRRRLNHVAYLRPLSREESYEYVQHRLHVANAKGDLISDSAKEALFEMTGGNIRAIDALAHKALIVAAIDKSGAVDTNHVIKAKTQVMI